MKLPPVPRFLPEVASASVPLFAIWAVVGVVLAWYHKKAIAVESTRERPRDLRWLSILSLLWHVLAPVAVGWYAIRRALEAGAWPGESGEDVAALLRGIAFPHITASAVVMYAANRFSDQRASAFSKRERLQRFCMMVAMVLILVSWPVLVAGATFPGGLVPGLVLAGVFVTAGLLALVGARRWIGAGSAASLITMEESPLRAELDRIAAHFGFPEANWSVQTFRTREGVESTATDVSLDLSAWWQRFSLRKPVLPIALLRALEAPAVTATVAMRCSRSYRRGGRRLFSKVRVGVARAIWLGIACAVFVGLSFAFPGLVSYVPLVAVLAGAVALVVRTGHARRSSSATMAAWEAWQMAAPDDERTPAMFVRHLLDFDRLTMPNLEGGLARRARANRALVDFLDRVAPGERESILEAIAEEERADGRS